MARNKLALNISQIKSIVFGTKHSVNPKLQLNLVINHVEIEQVENKLLGVTLDCKLSWSKHIDTVAAKIGRSVSIIKRCSAFLTTLSTRQVLVRSHLDYCSVVWSGATKKDFAIDSEPGSTADSWMYTES